MASRYLDVGSVAKILDAVAHGAGGSQFAARDNTPNFVGSRAGGSQTFLDYLKSTGYKPPKPKGTSSPSGGHGGILEHLKGIGGDILKGALNTIDTPRALVFAAGTELGQAVDPKRGHASFHDFLNETYHPKDRVSFSDLQYGNSKLGIKGLRDPKKDSSAHRLLLGLGGDIALDPLTYLAPEKTLAGIGKAEAAARVAETGGREVEQITDAAEKARQALSVGDIVAKARRGGVSALSREERIKYLGEAARGGLKLNVPGTGRIGRTLLVNPIRGIAGAEKLHDAVQVPLISERLTHPLSVALNDIAGKAHDVVAGTRVGQALGGADAELKGAIRAGGPDALDAANILREKTALKFAAPVREANYAHALDEATKGLPDHVKADLVKALGGDAEAEARVGEHSAKVRDLLDHVLTDLQGAGVNVKGVADYFPNQLSDGAKEALDIGKKGSFSSGRAFFENARELTDPEKGAVKFLDGVVEGATPDARRVEADRIFKSFVAKQNPKLADELGQVGTTLFSGDFDKVMGTYLSRASRRIELAHAAGRLADLGVGAKATDAVNPDLGPIIEQLQGARGEQALHAEEAGQARTALDSISQEGLPPEAAAPTEAPSPIASALEQITPNLEHQGQLATEAAQLPDTLKQSVRNMAGALKDARLIGGGTSVDRLDGSIRDLIKLAGFDPSTVSQLAPDEGNVFEKLIDPRKQFDSLRRELTHAAQDNVERVRDQAVHTAVVKTADQGAEAAQLAKATPEALAKVQPTTKEGAQWLDVQKTAAAQGNHDLAYVASLEQVAAEAGARADEAGQRALTLEDTLATMPQRTVKEFDGRIRAEMQAGLRQMLTDGVATPTDAAEALTSMGRVETHGFLKKYDSLLQYIKNGQIATPGFHFRNFFGGVWNNELAGMEFDSYRKWGALWKGGDKLSEEDQALRELVLRSIGRGQIGSEFSAGEKVGMGINPLARNFAPFTLSAKAGSGVEGMLRGALSLDTMEKGGIRALIADGADTDSLVERATQRVTRYHFDYSDLSDFERGTVKRIVPFYTWTRKNVPLQLESMIRNPRVFARYQQAKTEIEKLSGPDKTVPNYFTDELQTRLPFTENGGHLYTNLGLPLVDIAQTLDPTNTLSMVTPIIKAPIEYWAGKQTYEGIPLTNKFVPANGVLAAPGIGNVLRGLGVLRTGKDGHLFISEKNAYLAEQYLPLLGRVRRLAPTEPKYQDRAVASWASFAFGLGLRSNTASQQKSYLAGLKYEAQSAKSARTRANHQLGFTTPKKPKKTKGLTF